MSEFPPGRYYLIVANVDGARAAVDRNAAISQMRRAAITSNIGEPAMLFVAVPDGTEDEAAELIRAALDTGIVGSGDSSVTGAPDREAAA